MTERAFTASRNVVVEPIELLSRRAGIIHAALAPSAGPISKQRGEPDTRWITRGRVVCKEGLGITWWGGGRSVVDDGARDVDECLQRAGFRVGDGGGWGACWWERGRYGGGCWEDGVE